MKKIEDLKKIFAHNKLAEADILIADALGRDRAYVLAHPEKMLTICQYLKVIRAFRLFKKEWPIAYIIKTKDFFNLDFTVNKHVLIPRPETELLVEEVLKQIKNLRTTKNSATLIDVGTGSGCIPISIAKNTEQPLNIFGTDVFRSALCVAKKNAKRHNVQIKLMRGKLFKPFLKKYSAFIGPGFDVLITANLPYLTDKWVAHELSIRREPRSALVADNYSGLSLYEKLLMQIIPLFNAKPDSISIFLEIDPRQSISALEMCKKYFSTDNESAKQVKIEIKKDLAGRDRLVIIKTHY